MRKNWRFAKNLVLAVTIIWLAVQFLVNSAEAIAGARDGLHNSATILIPSLFPFMVLASLLPCTQVGRYICKPFTYICRFVYGLPKELAPALMMSWLGGYPAGSATLTRLYEQGVLSSENCKRAMLFLVNSGPAFMVAVVGAGIFGSAKIGGIIFVCQLFASLLLRWVLLGRQGIGALPSTAPRKSSTVPLSQALVTSVERGATSMLNIMAFVVICSAMLNIMVKSGILAELEKTIVYVTSGYITPAAATAFASSFVEICTGCSMARNLTPIEALSVLPFLLSFAGISAICQVASVCAKENIDMGKFVLSRFLHGVITQVLAYPLLKNWCSSVQTVVTTSLTIAKQHNIVICSVLLLVMCGIFFASLEQKY